MALDPATLGSVESGKVTRLDDKQVKRFMDHLQGIGHYGGGPGLALATHKEAGKKLAEELIEQSQSNYDKYQFPLFDGSTTDLALKNMGEWLVKSAMKEVPTTKFEKGDVDTYLPITKSRYKKGILPQNAIDFVDLFWLISNQFSDMDMFMFIYNMYKWETERTMDAYAKNADLRMEYIAFEFINHPPTFKKAKELNHCLKEPKHPINVYGYVRGLDEYWLHCVKKAKESSESCASESCPPEKQECISKEFAKLVREGTTVERRGKSMSCADVMRAIATKMKKLFKEGTLKSAVGKTDEPYTPYLHTKLKQFEEIIVEGRGASTAHRGYDDVFMPKTNAKVIKFEYGENNLENDWMNGFITGGLMGGSAIIVLILVFCIGVALGLVTYWGYTQKKALEESKDQDMYHNDERL
eukprot:63168_1